MVTVKSNPDTALDTIVADWHDCTKCEIGKHVRSHVFWDTDPKGIKSADLMFIGEGPGVTEDTLALPFVGAAGKLLRQAVKEAGRKGISIVYANLLVCRPYTTKATAQGNRAPEQSEVLNCMPRLIETIHAFNPTIILATGKEPSSYWPLIRDGLEIETMFEQILHPAYIVRQGGVKSPNYKGYVEALSNIFDKVRAYNKHLAG